MVDAIALPDLVKDRWFFIQSVRRNQDCNRLPHDFVGLMPLINYVSITQDGALHWNGKPISSVTLGEYLRQSRQLNPKPVVFLETEMGAPCEALEAVRKQMDEALECKKSGLCSEGIETVWRGLPNPSGMPPS